jgi:hypothetical protein
VAAKLPFHFLTYFPSGWNPLGNNDWPRIPWLHTTMIVGALLMHGTILWLGRRALDPRRPDPGNRALEIRKGLVLTATPVLLLLAFSAVVYPTLDARFVIFVLPTYWLVIVGLAERAGRAGTLLIYAVLLPWLGASIAVPLLRAVTGPALHDSVARIANAWRPGDLIVADTVIGRQVHWEWTRAFQRNDPMVIVARPGLLDAPSLPLRPLARTDLDGVRRVWLFHTEHNEQGVRGIRDSLERSNFVAISDSIAFVDRYDRP